MIDEQAGPVFDGCSHHERERRNLGECLVESRAGLRTLLQCAVESVLRSVVRVDSLTEIRLLSLEHLLILGPGLEFMATIRRLRQVRQHLNQGREREDDSLLIQQEHQSGKFLWAIERGNLRSAAQIIDPDNHGLLDVLTLAWFRPLIRDFYESGGI